MLTYPQGTIESAADDVERHDCPRCGVQPGSPCRSRAGTVAGIHHTGRFKKVPRLARLLRVPTPADRGPGQPWRPGTPPPAAPETGTPGADGGPGRMLFGFFTAMAETERESIREGTLEGLDAAARKGRHGGRPAVITDDMLHTVLRRRAAGESVDQIRPDLTIPTGKRKGQSPGLAGSYRELAEHERRQAYPEAVEAAHADFATLPAA
ncbi:recombinase family protein [Kitasatospora sp. NPDC048239]|uniref:zinc finger domain-containing protein n=1 Tax=Kitasatospora sp. NPDC048239 TaxID=3364046 RepID=UPI00371ECB78